MAADYPIEVVVGESKPVVVGIGNQDHETVQYTVVLLLQAVRFVENETMIDQEAKRDRFTAERTHNRRGSEAL